MGRREKRNKRQDDDITLMLQRDRHHRRSFVNCCFHIGWEREREREREERWWWWSGLNDRWDGVTVPSWGLLAFSMASVTLTPQQRFYYFIIFLFSSHNKNEIVIVTLVVLARNWIWRIGFDVVPALTQ
jgi:hypothetical protein